MPRSTDPTARLRVRRDRWEVVASHVADVASLAVSSIGEPAVRGIRVDVERWRAPQEGWLGDPRFPGIRSLRVEPTKAGIRVDVGFADAVDPGLALSAIVRILRPTAPLSASAEVTLAPGLPTHTGALAAWVHDGLLPSEDRDRYVRRCDTLVCAVAPDPNGPARVRTVVVEPDHWRVDDVAFPVSVDPAVHRPIGRRSTGPFAVAGVSRSDGRARVDLPDGTLPLDHVTPATVRRLRAVGGIVGDELPRSTVEQLNACGVVIAATATDLPDAADPFAWQVASVHARRHALRAHGPWAALDAWPSVSVVLVTHRPEQLDHAVGQLARLAYPRLEIVLGLHGFDDGQVRQRLAAVPHEVDVVSISSDATLGEALQRCSDRAQGALITKMDDDDHYGSEHIWDLVLARAYSGAQVVGKALDWIYLEQSDTTVFRPVYPAERYAPFVAGGTMLISRADLAAVGGWRPVPRSVDRALLDRVQAHGGLVYRTHGLGYVYVRRRGDRTAAVRDEHFRTKTVSTMSGLVRHPDLGTP